MKPIDCRIQDYYTQTGVGDTFRVMWKYGAGNQRQSAYQIDLYRGDALIWSSGKVRSDQQNNICVHCALEEQTQYGMTVSVWDESDCMECSDRVSFLSGVRTWRGEWIGNGTKKPFLIRRSFFVEEVRPAILSVCVPGQYEVRLNGSAVSSSVYEGSQTDFNKHIHYATYDVTPWIRAGENHLTIEVANGWYIGDDDGGTRYFYTMDKGYTPFGPCLAAIAQLKIGDEWIVTDPMWEVSRSQTTLASIYGSEDIDHTIAYEWMPAQCVAPPKGVLIPFDYPPVIRKYDYAVQHVDRERMIFDFGQNMSSQFYLKIKGKRGQTIKLIPAEKLSENGDLEQTAQTYSLLTLSGEEDVFEQKFSLTGARWYQLEGAEDAQILAFHLYFVTSSAADSGQFHCSDEAINRIYHMIVKTVESNLNHLHTDCPTLEKLGWLELNNLMARSIMYCKEVDLLWSKIAMDMRDAQYTEEEYDVDNGTFPHVYRQGLVPSIAPRYAKFTTGWQDGSFWDIVPWGSSLILAAYEQYRFYGNQQVLTDNYDAAKRYMTYLTEQYQDYARRYGKESDECFLCAGLGDWGTVCTGSTGRENIETAFYYHDLTVMADISRILGKGEEEAFCRQAEQVKARYNEALLVKKNGGAYYRDYVSGARTQANQAIPLCFGLVPEEQIAAVQASLIALCDGQHLTCGEIALPYLFRALARAGRNDIVYDMIHQETHPSYLRFLEMGETTLPEYWRDDARSRNHDMMGHILEWFFTEVAGISSEDGFRTVRIAPHCTDLVSEVQGVFHSIRGTITWHITDGTLTVVTPHNMTLR